MQVAYKAQLMDKNFGWARQKCNEVDFHLNESGPNGKLFEKSAWICLELEVTSKISVGWIRNLLESGENK